MSSDEFACGCRKYMQFTGDTDTVLSQEECTKHGGNIPSKEIPKTFILKQRNRLWR